MSAGSRLVGAIVLYGLVTAAFAISTAQAITKSEVEDACADSSEGYDTYQTARADFLEATEALDEANWALAEAEAKEQRIRDQFESNEQRREELVPEAEAQAVELYMRSVGGDTPSLVALDKPEEALVAFSFLAANRQRSVEGLDALSATTSDLDRLGGDLEEVVDERTALRDDQQALTAQQQAATDSALASYDQLTDRCRQLQADYEAEQAKLRAEEEARKRREAEARERAESGGSSGGSGQTVDGVICPFTPGRTQFTNSFGAPRSGGRSHRGTDMFAPWDEPVYAVESGTVVTANRGLGGKLIWLTANSGTAYYYAHLNGFNVSDGATVSQGDLIGFNGNSGNAVGTSPHVHLQIHPNGRGGAVINPYYTMATVCF